MKVMIRNGGFSLVVVMVFIAVLSSLSIIAVKRGGLTSLSIYDGIKSKEAYYTAEAAFQHALFKISANKDWRGELTDQSFSGGTYSLKVSQANSIDDVTITVSSSFGGMERTVVRVVPESKDAVFIIRAFAGTGGSGDQGDNGPAVDAKLSGPIGVSKNTAGDVFIADAGNNKTRYVPATSKNIYSFAGSGTNGGYNCNDCDPMIAYLNKPNGIYADNAGNVYIADTVNHLVRKVIAGGNIIDIAGTPNSSGFSGDGGLATNAKLYNPTDVAVDSSGNVYIVDSQNCRIRRVDAATKIITTYAGTNGCGFTGDGGPAVNAKLNKPIGLDIDAQGNIYIADTENHKIRKVDSVTKKITTIAGTTIGFAGDGGLATKARLNKPRDVAVNRFASVYIGDTINCRVRKIDPATGVITTVVGTGSTGNTGDGGLATEATLGSPESITAFDDVDGHLIISDPKYNRVREVTSEY